MSLITRCPACRTMFRVVPDQLKVSEGWVRCGQCEEIFDASAHLQNLQDIQDPQEPVARHAPDEATEHAHLPEPVSTHESPSEEATPDFAATDVQIGLASALLAQHAPAVRDDAAGRRMREMLEPAVDAPGPDSGFPTHESAFPVTEFDGGHPALGDPTASGRMEPSLGDPGDAGAVMDAPGVAPARASGAAGLVATSTPDVAAVDTVASAAASAVTSATAPAAASTAIQGADLSFVRKAQRRARWQRWPVRLALSGVALVLAGLLAAQILWQERDRLAAFHPSLRPAIEETCGLIGCEVRPLRQIDAVVIDGSAFTKLRGDLFRLSMTLRNNGPVSVAAPAVELALTDGLDQAVVRRVLQPADLGARAGVIGAKGELQSTLVLSIKGGVPAERIAGYRLLAFYP